MAKRRGRPLKYDTPEKLEKAVDAWIEGCRARGEPLTMSGALLELEFYHDGRLTDYERREGFSGAIKKLRKAIESEYERRLHGPNAAGAIFALKNMGWSDSQHLMHTGKDGGAIKTESKLDPSGLSDSALQELMAARKSEDG